MVRRSRDHTRLCDLARGKLDDGRLHGRDWRAILPLTSDGYQGDELDDRRLAGYLAGRCFCRDLDHRRGLSGLHELILAPGVVRIPADDRTAVVSDGLQHGMGTDD